MGTQADFYIGRGKNAKWIGGWASEGYPDNPDLKKIYKATTRKAFVAAVEPLLFVRASEGWPWQWPSSHVTDYSYAFDKGKVWVSERGKKWLSPKEALKIEATHHYGTPEEDSLDWPKTPRAVFPRYGGVKKAKEEVGLGGVFDQARQHFEAAGIAPSEEEILAYIAEQEGK
jgi:hypothetical protein